jgi:hypothetical protein
MRSVYNEERSAPFVNPCARDYEMSLLIDQSPGASFRKTGFKKAELIRQRCRALDQIATLPATPALRREQIKLQVALITPLMHIKGYSAPETKAAAEQARLLIELAETQGEPPEDPLLLFSALNGFWYANLVAFNGDVVRDLAAQFLALLRSGGRPYRSWSGTASRVLHCCAREISWTAELDIPVKILQDSNEGRIESHRKPMGVVGSITPWNFR